MQFGATIASGGCVSHHSLKTPMRRIQELMGPDRSDLWIIMAYSVGIGLLTLALPIASQSLINTVAFGTVLQPLVVLSLLLFLALAVASALQVLRHWLVEVLQRRYFVRVTGTVSDRLLHAKTSFFDDVHGPELVNRFLDVAIVQKSVAVLLIDGLTIVMQTAAGLLLLAVYHPLLLVFDAVLLASILFILFGLGRNAVRTSIAESQAKYEVLAWLEELARHRGTFRSDIGRSYGWNRTNDLTGQYLRDRSSHFRVELRQIIGSLLLQAFAIATLLGFGGYLVTLGQLTLGQLVAGELVVGTVVYGFTKLNKSLESFYDLSAAVDELGMIEDVPVEAEGGHKERVITSAAAGLTAVNVQYSYDKGGDALQGIELQIAPGEKAGIYGSLGAGKSTLMDVLSSLRQPAAGHLQLDEQDYREVNLEHLRSRVILVRDADVFAGSLQDNLTMGQEATHGQIRRVLDQVGLQSAVTALPDALLTQLSTNGAPLTRAQALRLAIARALLSLPSVLLLDGVLDEMEGLHGDDTLLTTLFAPDAPWTLLVATQRAAVLQRCNRTFELKSGTLRERSSAADRYEEAQ